MHLKDIEKRIYSKTEQQNLGDMEFYAFCQVSHKTEEKERLGEAFNLALFWSTAGIY